MSRLSFRMNGQKQWTRVAVIALLVLTAMAAEGGKAEKQGEACKPCVSFSLQIPVAFIY